MNKSGLAGIGLGALALVLAVVNMVRVSGALDRLGALDPKKTDSTGPGDTKVASLTDEQRREEIEYLKRETKRISEEIARKKAEIDSGTGSNPLPDPDGKTPLKLTPAQVAQVLDRILEQRFKDQKAREAEIQVEILGRNKEAQLSGMEAHMKLDAPTKAKVEAILKDQLEGYAAILRTFPVPDDKQAQLDKVTQKADEEMGRVLNEQQLRFYKASPNWHGYSQKVDTKRDSTPTPPRRK